MIAAATALAYFPSLRGGFVLDDNILLTDNGVIKAPDGLYRIWFTTDPIDYWPVFNSTFWIEWRLWGLQPAGYHVINLLLHITAALLIWAVLQRIAVPGAFLAALLFAVHPVNVESVAWISQCKSVLAMVFFLLSILAYLQAETRVARSAGQTDRWYWLSLAAFVLAMLSKGSVAILPLVLLSLVWWLRPLTRGDLQRIAPFILVAVLLVLVNMWFQTHGAHTEVRSAGFVERVLGAAAGVWFYLSKAILPINLVFIYPQWHIRVNQWQWWVPLLAAVAVTGVLWQSRRGWGRPLWFAWLYFCVSLVPVLGFTDVAFMEHSLVADHYQHLALIGALALVAGGWGVWRRQARSARWLPTAAAIGVVAGLMVLTWRQSGLYAEAMTLYEATVAGNPDSWLAHNNLGGLLTEADQLPQAIEHYEHALRLKPDYPDAHNNLGVALRRSGRLPEAIAHFREALRLKPDYLQAHYNLGSALAEGGQHSEAIEHFTRALELRPNYPEVRNDLGIALARTGRFPEAVAQLQEALRLKPDFADAQFNLELAASMQHKAANSVP